MMKHFLEIYRPIAPESADALKVASRRICEVFGMSPSSQMLEFGTSPKVSIYRVGGRAALDLYSEQEALMNVLESGINARTVEPDLILWGFDLPKSKKDAAERRIGPHCRPRVELAERLDPETRLGNSTDAALEDFVKSVVGGNTPSGHGFAKGGLGVLEKRVIHNIKLIGVDTRPYSGRVPTMGYVAAARSKFADLVPSVELGPARFGIVPETTREINNYGYLLETGNE